MKKLLSIVLSMILVLGTISVIPVSATATLPTPIIDLDFSDYKITNSGSSTTAAPVEVVGAPALREEATAKGIRGYVQFEDEYDTETTGTNTTGLGYLKVTDSNILNNKNITVSTWFKTNTTTTCKSTWNTFMNFSNGSLSMIESGSTMYVGDKGKTASDNAIGITKGDWTHLVYARSYDEATTTYTVTVYVNGVNKGSWTYNYTSENSGVDDMLETTGAYLNVGGNGSTYYCGGIADLKVYGATLTGEQVEASYNAETALYSAAATDYAMGAKTLDLDYSEFKGGSTGIKNSITDVAATMAASGAPTVRGEITAEGTRRYLKFTDDDGNTIGGSLTLADGSLFGKEQMTFETWFKTGEAGTIVSANDTEGTDKQSLSISNAYSWGGSGYAWQVKPLGSGTGRNDDQHLKIGKVDGSWEHLVVTRWKDSTNWYYRIYVDGAVVVDTKTKAISGITEALANGLLDDNTYYLSIGSSTLKGGISTMKMYDTALSQYEVEKIYANSKAFYEAETIKVEDPIEKVFGLDFSEYDPEKGTGLKNSVENSTAEVKIVKEGYSPALKVDSIATGETRSYLEFHDGTNSNGRLRIWDDLNSDDAFNDTDSTWVNGAFTVETWYKETSANASGAQLVSGIAKVGTSEESDVNKTNFALSNAWSNNQLMYKYYAYNSADATNNDLSGGGKFYTSIAAGTWHHLVYTTENISTTTTPKWELKVYIDNTLKGTYTYDESTGTSGTMSFLNQYFNVGGGSDESSWRGSISTFNIYNKALTAGEVSTQYNREVAFYGAASVEGEVVLDGEGLKFTDQSGAELEELDGDVTTVNASVFVANTTTAAVAPVVIMAQFRGDRLIKAQASVADETIGANSRGMLEATLTDISLQEGDGVQLFVWNSIATIEPLMGSGDLSISYPQGL